ncbi:hypothetical protein A3Q56_03024 [Intoshia linei]|uniref:Exostosin GT47 domain-containing protein n=1 Tax=Intoshia linei TaxID=1819745 RepID=A0A177B4P2_9BILA|nr:hypothetical protein A3Q56_03024 [Intoshia linei]
MLKLEMLILNVLASKCTKFSISIDNINDYKETNDLFGEISKFIKKNKNKYNFVQEIKTSCAHLPSISLIDRDIASYNIQPDVSSTFRNKYDPTDYGFPDKNIIKIKSSSSTTEYRPNLDVSFPLPPKNLEKLSILTKKLKKINDRSIFLSFKGVRYTTGPGSVVRNRLFYLEQYPLNVIILTKCKYITSYYKKSCRYDVKRYALFLEIMQRSCIPIILSDAQILPFSEVIDWSLAVFKFNESEIIMIPQKLQNVNKERRQKMSQQITFLYNKYFSSIEKILETSLQILKEQMFPNKKKSKHDWNESNTEIWNGL